MNFISLYVCVDAPHQPRGRYHESWQRGIVQHLEDVLLAMEQEGTATPQSDSVYENVYESSPMPYDAYPSESPASRSSMRRMSLSKSSEDFFGNREEMHRNARAHGAASLSDGEESTVFPNFQIGFDNLVPWNQANYTISEEELQIYSPTTGIANILLSSSAVNHPESDEAEEEIEGFFASLLKHMRKWLTYIYNTDVEVEEGNNRPVYRRAFPQNAYSRIKIGGDVGEWNLSEEDFAKAPNDYLRVCKAHPGVCVARRRKFPVLNRNSNPLELRIEIRTEARRYFGLLIHKYFEVARKWGCHTLSLPDLTPDLIQWFSLDGTRGLVKCKEVIFDRFYLPQNYERIFFEGIIRRMPEETRRLLQKHFERGPWASKEQFDQSLEIRFGFQYKRWERGRVASAFSFVNLNADFVRTILCWIVLFAFVLNV